MNLSSMSIMYIGAIFLGGWLWSYVFIRQIMFNFIIANPLIKGMRAQNGDLIAVGAKRYTVISTVICAFFAALILFVVLRFCPIYAKISFGVGAVIAFVMLFRMVNTRNHAMFDTFCAAYYRFVPDDELRTAFYNKKIGPIRSRLKEMGFSSDFLPSFK